MGAVIFLLPVRKPRRKNMAIEERIGMKATSVAVRPLRWRTALTGVEYGDFGMHHSVPMFCTSVARSAGGATMLESCVLNAVR